MNKILVLLIFIGSFLNGFAATDPYYIKSVSF